MGKQPDTLEFIAIQLASIVAPVKEGLTEGEVGALFAELGVNYPAVLAGNAQFTAALQTVVDAASELPAKVQGLVAAIDDEREADILNISVDLILAIKALIDGLDTIVDALKALPAGTLNISGAELDAFARRILDYLVVSYIEGALPLLAAILEFFEIIERSLENEGSTNPLAPEYIKRVVNLKNIGELIKSPSDHMKNLYKWGNNTFDGKVMLEKLAKVFTELGVPVLYDPIAPKLDMGMAELSPKTDISPKGLSLLLKAALGAGASYTVSKDDWSLKTAVAAGFKASTDLTYQPGGKITIIPPSGSVEGQFSTKWTLKSADPNQPYTLMGKAGGSRLEVKELSVGAGGDLVWSPPARADGEVILEAEIKEGKIIISPAGSDGFISKLLPPDGVQIEFDIVVGVSSETGFYFKGSSALEISIPLHLSLGPIEIQSLIVGVGASSEGIPIKLGANIKAALGPMVAVVRNVGVIAEITFPDSGGNLGPLNISIEFKPPSGLGLSIDTGVVKGAGFLDVNVKKGEYIGALELEVVGLFSLKALAIINTKLPDNSKGYSLLVMITSEFSPIQLGYGFTLNAVGGMLGLNRSVRINALREGVKTNAIKSVLFPENIVANIDRIISDLKQIFPIYEGHFIICPMGKLGWGTPSIITLELGLLLEIPAPRVAILGVLKAVLPEEDTAVLTLQVNFLGVLDVGEGYISLDASLYDSRLLLFTLTGDMAFRLVWGNNALFILSVGGFHPAFKDAPSDLKNMARLAISLSSGNNPRISIECYFAVTSNTVQFGAKAELYAAAAGFNVYGFIGFDVLFQFVPFHFVADFYAGLTLRKGSRVLMGLNLSGALAGPTPWDVRGEASFKILLLKIKFRFHETWGDRGTYAPLEKEDVLKLLKGEVGKVSNWKAEIPKDSSLHVSVKKIEQSEDKTTIHPFGVLTFTERLVPLDVTIDKFGNKEPKDVDRFTLTEIKSNATVLQTKVVKEQFAYANFFEISDSEKLSRPSFEWMAGGFKIIASSSLSMPPRPVSKSVDYEFSYLRKKTGKLELSGIYRLAKTFFKAAVRGSAVSKSNLSFQNNRISTQAPEAVEIEPEKYIIANVSDMQPHRPGLVADSYTEASEMYRNLIAANPEKKGRLQIVSSYELN